MRKGNRDLLIDSPVTLPRRDATLSGLLMSSHQLSPLAARPKWSPLLSLPSPLKSPVTITWETDSCGLAQR